METKALLNEHKFLKKHEPNQFYRFVIRSILLTVMIGVIICGLGLLNPRPYSCRKVVSSPTVYSKWDISETGSSRTPAVLKYSPVNALSPRGPTATAVKPKSVESSSNNHLVSNIPVKVELQLKPEIVESLLSAHKVVCPLSINTVVDMLSKGLDAATLEELTSIASTHDALKLDENVIVSKNSIWNVKLFSEEFLNAVEPRNAVKYEALNVDAVNIWVNEATDGRISKFLNKVNEEDGMIINVVLFKALWNQRFYSQNELSSFNDLPKAAKMMSHTAFYSVHLNQENKPTAIIVPFEHGYSAILSMPYDPSLKSSDFKNERVALTIPQFNIESEVFDLSTDFKKMGVQKIFEGSVPVTQMLHKVAIKVNEYGCEAVAVTAAMIAGSARYENDPIDFVIDRTFGFVIVHNETQMEIFKAIVDTSAVQAASN